MMSRSMIAAGILTIVLAGCSAEARLKEEIADANYCDTRDDCSLIGSKCPFDCYIYVNGERAKELREKVENFASSCEYSCVASTGVACRNHKCVAIVDVPTEENLTGKRTGEACVSDDECATPIEYLTRSVCPYASRCVDGACAVTCPMPSEDPNAEPSETWVDACSSDAECDCGRYAPEDRKACRCVSGQCVAVVGE